MPLACFRVRREGMSAMLQDSFKPSAKVFIAATGAVTATYVYFLLFAQFGFLKAVLAAGSAVPPLKVLMTVMGAAGMLASAAVARGFTIERTQRALRLGFALCAGAAGLSLVPASTLTFVAVAGLVGAGLGLTTVALVCVLRRALGGARLGTVIGLGTGLAYGFCNLPTVFTGSAPVQAGIALAAALGGLVAALKLELKTSPNTPTGYDYTPAGMAVWVLVFLVLVGLDSAAFYVIQHTPTLTQSGWSRDSGLWVNAGVHFVAALLTGYALDQRWMGRSMLLGAGALFVACVLLDEGTHAFAQGTLLYTAGVSIYSTVLVFYPARGMRPWLAAAVYAIAGWFGSGLGIGLAENMQRLPLGVIAFAAGVVGVAMVIRQRGHEAQLKAFHG